VGCGLYGVGLFVDANESLSIYLEVECVISTSDYFSTSVVFLVLRL